VSIPRVMAVSDLAWSIAALILAAGVLWTTWHLPHQTDFFDLRIYRDAVRYWLHGHDLYAYWEPHTARLGFTYPPFAAVVLTPLAMLPARGAWWTMTALSLVICIVAGGRFGASIGARFHRPPVVAGILGVALVLGLEPIRESLGFGQINIVLLGLVLLDMWLLSTGRAGSGIAIGLAAAIKLTPAVLIVALLFSGQRSAARRAALAFVGAGALAAACDGRESWRYWTSIIWKTDRVGLHPAKTGNQSLSGVVARAEHLAHPTSIWLFFAVAALALSAWFAHRATGWWADIRLLCVAAAASTAASPISWTHHYWWCVPALGAMTYFAARTGSLLAWFALVLSYGAFAIGPIQIAPYLERAGLGWANPIRSDLYGYISLLICLVLIFGRTPDGARGPARAAAASRDAARKQHSDG
jgi:alpha-1,2-mannosyltransferase